MKWLRAAIMIFGGLYAGGLWGQSAWPSYPNNTAISVSSAGKVGIGTTSPVAKLNVDGGQLFVTNNAFT